MAKTDTGQDGKLRIGDQWNAIRIIALSQSNPLKAIAEFVENSIDAQAKQVTIIRGKQGGEQYLRIVDDGNGIEDFGYVATHIGDSIKRRLKERGAQNIQGEFGIGLLSFWTVGEELSLISMASDGVARRLRLVKESPEFAIRETRELFDRSGTVLQIQPLLPGVKVLSGEKIQAYLASELRDRISKSGVTIRIVDRSSRKELVVEPRAYHGHLLHELPQPRSPFGEIYLELYIADPSSCAGVSLYRQGTRVEANLTHIEAFRKAPWNTGYLEGIVDASFLQLTPGTRSGFIFDTAFDSLVSALEPIEAALSERIDAQRRAEDEEASRSILKKITRALREAFSLLPEEEYGWLVSQTQGRRSDSRISAGNTAGAGESTTAVGAGDPESGVISGSGEPQSEHGGAVPGEEREFFEIAGPLYSVIVRPAAAIVGIGKTRALHAVARDKSKRLIDDKVQWSWEVTEGAGVLDTETGEFVTFLAPDEPELSRVSVTATQDETEVKAEAILTVTAELVPQGERPRSGKGLPGYTYSYSAGQLWRSRYSEADALITINSAHPDFVHSAKSPAMRLRYVARLFAKEIVRSNFPGASPDELLERMVELITYMEEYLR